LSATAGWTYVYDGDGHRVKKFSGSTGTLYWPDLNGNNLNESSLGATNLHEYVYFAGKRIARIDVPTPLTVKYYFSDHLGSASVITDASGTIVDESDYYPYGGEIAITDSDPNTYKFTGKERDAESGLDEFGARYYTSAVGRFMIPDWAEKPTTVPYASFGNPQSLNLYSYVNNNPTTTRDPDGHQCPGCAQIVDFVEAEGPAVEDWAIHAAAGAGALLTAAASGAGQLGNAYPSYYHGELQNADGSSIFLSKNNGAQQGSQQTPAQSNQSSQSTPAQPEGGNDKYENSPENQSRMSQGKAPVGQDGKPVELHHEGQSSNGQLKEMTQTEHRGGENFKNNHPNTGQQPSKIDRNKFKQQRQAYWKNKIKKPNE
jgi:RHS repeat-associated protein